MMTQRELLQDLNHELAAVEQEQQMPHTLYYNERTCYLEHRQRVLEHKIRQIEDSL